MSWISTKTTWEFYKWLDVGAGGGTEKHQYTFPLPNHTMQKKQKTKQNKKNICIQVNDSFSWLIQHSSWEPNLYILLFP